MTVAVMITIWGAGAMWAIVVSVLIGVSKKRVIRREGMEARLAATTEAINAIRSHYAADSQPELHAELSPGPSRVEQLEEELWWSGIDETNEVIDRIDEELKVDEWREFTKPSPAAKTWTQTDEGWAELGYTTEMEEAPHGKS